MKISVCTLAHGREDHLCNLVRGLNRSHRPPCELLVAVMQDQRYELPETGFPVRQVTLGSGRPLIWKGWSEEGWGRAGRKGKVRILIWTG